MASTGEVGRLSRRPALDGLRALSFLAVFVSHLPDSPFHGGGEGVLVFFALSGFLITTLLLQEREDEGRIALGRFYLRRAARLLPAAALVILTTLIVVLVFVDVGPVVRYGTVRGALPSLFYYANWLWFFNGFGYEQLGMLGQYWSLSVEEQFYLVWPLALIAVLSRRSERALVPLLVAVCLCSIWFRTQADAPHSFFGTHVVADQLAWGALGAVAVRQWPRAIHAAFRWLAIPAVAVVVGMMCFQRGASPFGATGIAVASTVLVGHLATRRSLLARLLEWRPLAYLGRISYGLYLWHCVVVMVAFEVIHNQAVLALVGGGLTVAVAALSFHFYELPIMRAVAGAQWRPAATTARPPAHASA